MIVLGLTGGIATGKSTASKMFAHEGVPIFDADACVHQMMKYNSTLIKAVEGHFPEAVQKQIINRSALGAIVFQDEQKLTLLESLIHPHVRAQELAFIQKHKRARRDIILLDIPLLFETDAHTLCDLIAVTHCPVFIQWQRAMRRPRMSEEKLRSILQKQMHPQERLARADWVLQSGIGKYAMLKGVKQLIKEL